MTNLHRREVLGGLAATVGSSFAGAQPMAVVATEPPAQGSLSAAAVSSLLAQHKVPGVGLAIVQNAAVVATYGYGNAQPGRPVTPQTRFQAASISKTINALTVLKLAEADELRLHDPVNQRLRSWKLPENVLTEVTPVTIRMLLNHTAGTTVSGFEGYAEGAPLPTLIQVLNGTPPANSSPVRVEWPPGKTFHYSGGGTTVLQQMVMDVTMGSYSKVVYDLTFDLLQMRSSNFDQPPPGSDFATCAFGARNDGTQLPGGFRVYPELAAAGLWTTPNDLALMMIGILQSHAGRPGSFLPAARAREMLTPAIEGAALGTFIDAKGMFWHNGGNAGYRSLYIGDPVSGNGMAAMTNGDDGEAVCTELRNRVAAAYAWR